MPLDPARDIKIGTSGYAYPGPPPAGWYGTFYPERKRKGFDELGFYAAIFNTCEINNSFYRPPSAAVAKAWVQKTPDDFSFVLKLWQKFTHSMKILRNSAREQWEPPTQADFDEFRAGILPLAEAGKLGALLLQYPAGFHFSEENAAGRIYYTKDYDRSDSGSIIFEDARTRSTVTLPSSEIREVSREEFESGLKK